MNEGPADLLLLLAEVLRGDLLGDGVGDDLSGIVAGGGLAGLIRGFFSRSCEDFCFFSGAIPSSNILFGMMYRSILISSFERSKILSCEVKAH